MSQAAEEIWVANRRRLLDIAYRMLGSRADAEDVVQDAYLRLSKADLEEIQDPTGWLITVTGRLCLDQLRSARRRRENYVGPWLPEPIVEGPLTADPLDRITLDDSVRMALLVVLEQLTPPERAAFILHDVFQLDYERIADIVGRTPEACRQLASRARQRIGQDIRPRFDPDPGVAIRLAAEFAAVCQSGDLEGLVNLLDPQVRGLFDSGGHIPGAPTELLVGSGLVASTLVAVFADSGANLVVVPVNGEPGVAVTVNGALVSVISLEVTDGKIIRVHGIGNPEKLPDWA